MLGDERVDGFEHDDSSDSVRADGCGHDNGTDPYVRYGSVPEWSYLLSVVFLA
jgi:hypothetical protein